MSEFANIDFGFRYGLRDELNRTSIKNGTFNITTDYGDLYIDIMDRRIPIQSIIADYTQDEIYALPNPEQKLYLAKDTANLFWFYMDDLEWKTTGAEVEFAQKAVADQFGRDIDSTYETKDEARNLELSLQEGIDQLARTVGDINRFNVIMTESEEDLPEIGELYTIYFVPEEPLEAPGEDDQIKNLFGEYLWIETSSEVDPETNEVITEGYYEKIGLTTLDITNYYTKGEIDVLLSGISEQIGELEGSIGDASGSFEEAYSELDGKITTLSGIVEEQYMLKSQGVTGVTISAGEITVNYGDGRSQTFNVPGLIDADGSDEAGEPVLGISYRGVDEG